MINVNTLKPGITFQHNKNIFIVITASHSKSARGQAHVKVKCKNLRSNAIVQLTFTGGDRVEAALIEKIFMQFLYESNNLLVFMNNNTFEQVELDTKKFKWETNFLKNGLNLELIYFQSECLGMILPDKIALEVQQASHAVRGDTSGNATKKVTLETGYEVDVPLFIKQGETILINSQDGKYSSRVN